MKVHTIAIMKYYYRRGNKYFFRDGKNNLNLESFEFDKSLLKRGQKYEIKLFSK